MKTKWVPMVSYNHMGHTFIVLCRKNLKTGMLYFKVKRMNGIFSLMYVVPKLDANIQFDFIMSLTGEEAK